MILRPEDYTKSIFKAKIGQNQPTKLIFFHEILHTAIYKHTLDPMVERNNAYAQNFDFMS